jgi:hypothetical protein
MKHSLDQSTAEWAGNGDRLLIVVDTRAERVDVPRRDAVTLEAGPLQQHEQAADGGEPEDNPDDPNLPSIAQRIHQEIHAFSNQRQGPGGPASPFRACSRLAYDA